MSRFEHEGDSLYEDGGPLGECSSCICHCREAKCRSDKCGTAHNNNKRGNPLIEDRKIIRAVDLIMWPEV